MPAKIIVLSGQDKGKEMWVEDEVVRIGRGGNCAIALSDPHLPEHVATLEFRDGHFNLHSRMEDNIVLAGKAVGPRALERWPGGKDLQLPGAVVLRLEVERDPRPMKRRLPAAAPPQAEPETYEPAGDDEAPPPPVSDEEAAKKRSRQFTYLLLILLCALGGVYFLFFEEDPAAGPRESPTKKFAFLVRTFYDKKAKDPRYQELREALQEARTAELRNDKADALKKYSAIRDTLISWKSNEGLSKEDVVLLEDTLRFVAGRLRTASAADE